MNRSRGLIGAGVLVAGLALAGLVAAQDANKATPPGAPAGGAITPAPAPAMPPPVTTAVPNTPAAKALANAITPEEGAAPPKSEETAKPKVAIEPPAPKPPVEPLKRPRYTAAILQAVDKITAETLRFESKVGQATQFKGLVLTVRACEATAADEPAPDNVAYLEVQSQPQTAPGHAAAQARQVFRGWMFASAPTLHPFEHPIYDLWLIACKTDAPEAAPPAPPARPIAPKSPSTAKAAAKRA